MGEHPMGEGDPFAGLRFDMMQCGYADGDADMIINGFMYSDGESGGDDDDDNSIDEELFDMFALTEDEIRAMSQDALDVMANRTYRLVSPNYKAPRNYKAYYNLFKYNADERCYKDSFRVPK